MTKGYKRILALLIATTLLTGCGKKKVDYNNAADGDNATLEAQLQLNGLETWKEDVTTKYGNLEINSTIVVPDTPTMYTYTVHERYLTNEEKKNIMTCFVDESSIKVDKVLEPTKEKLQSVLDEHDQNNWYISQFSRNYLEEKIDAAPFAEQLTEDTGDYSSRYYRAENEDFRYYFEFRNDSQYNNSYFEILRVNKNEMVFPEDKEKNICSMTKEEAEQKAISILADLGISNMKPVSVQDWLVYPNCYNLWYESGREDYEEIVSNSEDDGDDGDDGDDACWKNGYVITLSRDINGIGASPQEYMYCDTEGGNDEAQSKPYDAERVVMAIDDDGVIEIRCLGLMDEGTLNSPVKLLSFEQIQGIIREELKNTDTEYIEKTWPRIRLTYMRMENKDVADEYCYIPVWCFDNYINDAGYDFSDEIIVNAIDGKVMNPIEDGLVNQYSSQFEIGYY